MELEAYTDRDLWLTEALETDPEMMSELGGPIERERLPGIHRRRVADPWWFKIAAEPGGPALGTIGVWETRHGVHQADFVYAGRTLRCNDYVLDASGPRPD